MTKFYLAADGVDSNDGLSPDAPWGTMERLNDAIRLGEFVAGDSARFRRGDRFPGVPMVPGHTDNERPWITFGPYGTGAMPIFDMYKYPLTWANVSGNVWRARIDETGVYDGWLSDKSDVGFIKVDGVIHGRKRLTQAALSQQWDFFSGTYASPGADGYVYVYSVGDPATVADEIGVATYGVWTEEYGDPEYTPAARTAIFGIDIMGTGGTGLQASAFWAPDFVNAYGCRFHEHGGAYISGFAEGTRVGNGVTALIGCNDWYVEYNEVFDVFDVAFSLQGDQAWEGFGSSSRIHMDNNRSWRCSQTIEYWSDGTDGIGYQDVTFNRNVGILPGYNWSWPVRLDPAGRGCQVLLYQHEIPLGVEIAHNVFYGARTNYVTVTEGFDAALRMHDNTIYLDPSLPIQFGQSYTVDDAAAWQAFSGVDQGSLFFSLPDDPAGLAEVTAFLESGVGSLTAQVGILSEAFFERIADADYRLHLLETAPVDPVQAGVALISVSDDPPEGPNGTIVVDRPIITDEFTSSFTAANGSPWPTGWVPEYPSWLDGIADIQSNMGRLVPQSGADWAQAWSHHTDTVNDAIVTGRVRVAQFSGTSGAIYAEVRLRAQGEGYDNTLEGVGLSISPIDKVRLMSTVDGSDNTFYGELPGVEIVAGSTYRFKVQAWGNKLSAKVWPDAGDEPVGWQATVAIPSGFDAGGLTLSVQQGPGQRVDGRFSDIVLSSIAPTANIRGIMIDGVLVDLAGGA